MVSMREVRVVAGLGATHVDGSETGTVTGGHILVHALDSVGAGHVAVLAVHVVGAGTGVVTDPDAEVLDLHRALLVDLASFAIRQQNPSNTILSFPVLGLRLHTTFKLTISPLAFLTFLNLAKKYQNLLLATTSLGAKMRMR